MRYRQNKLLLSKPRSIPSGKFDSRLYSRNKLRGITARIKKELKNEHSSLQAELANKKELVECAKKLGVVGDVTRLKICYLLCHYPELNVSEIAEILDTSVSVVSHSVKKLRELQLVERRKESQTVYYSLTANDFTRTLKKFIWKNMT